MMTSDDEGNDVERLGPMTPKVRKFGTDLRTSARANRSSAKKVVKVRKSSSATKPRKPRTTSESTTTTRQHAVSIVTSNNDASDLAYSVVFEPGSIGLKLEPVVESMGREVGCRVLEFADGGEEDPGQARATKRIRPGDLLVAIDGRDVISWNYPDIIALLRQTAKARKRTLAFRSVWTPTDTTTSAESTNEKISAVKEYEATEGPAPVATPVKQRELSYGDDSSTADGFTLTQSPAESVLHSHFLSGFQPVEYDTSERIDELRTDLSTEQLLPTRAPLIDENLDSSSTELQTFEPDIDADSCFSPSRVKELSTASSFDSNGRTSPPPKQLSNVVKTVYNSVAPAAGVVASSSYSLTSTLTAAMSKKLGEALVGHKSKDFDSAVQLKMQLLSELSQAKVTLDRNLEEQRQLEALGQQLTEERDSEREARESERVAREELERDLATANEEKATLDLRLQRSKQKIIELSEQVELEQHKLRNTLKDSDMKVRNLESQVALLSSQAEHDRARVNSESAEREQALRNQLSEANGIIKSLQDTIQTLQDEVKHKDAKLVTAENTIEAVRTDAKAVEANLSRSLEVAIESNEATENTLRALREQLADKDGKLNESSSRLKQVADENQAMKDERVATLEELERLRALVAVSDKAKVSLESELVASREQAKDDADGLRATVVSLRHDLAAKDMSLKTIVQTTNALQAEYNSCNAKLLALQAAGEEAQGQKLRAENELKTSQIHTRQLEQLRDMMSEKDNKLASLDSQFREARGCLEGMNQKLHEKIEALSIISDREQKLSEENSSLRCRISDLEGEVEQADHERGILDREKEFTLVELSNVRSHMNRLETILEEVEDSRDVALNEIESLKESERKLTERNANLQVDLELTETKLAASGMSFLSKSATIEELRSVLATNDLSSTSVTAELETLRSKHEEALADVAELEAAYSELEEQNESLTAEIMSTMASSSASESANVDLQENMAFVEQQLIDTRKMLSSSQAQVLRKEEELISLRNEVLNKSGATHKANTASDDQMYAVSEERAKKLRALNEEVVKSRSLLSRATTDITLLKGRHENELKRIRSEFSAEGAALEQSHELVVDRFKDEVDQAIKVSKELEEKYNAAKGRLTEVLETVRLQEETLYAERGRFNKEKQALESQIQRLEREKSGLESGRRRLSEQVSFLSEKLDSEKRNVSSLGQSRNLASLEARKLRSEMEEMQKDHLEDIEQTLKELDSRTRDETAAALAKKADDKNAAVTKDLERSLARSQKEVDDLRCALKSCQKQHEETTNQLRMHHAEVEKEMGDRLFEKEEEIVSCAIRLDATENSLAEANVERMSLETKIVQTESRAFDAISEAERLSRRIAGMEDDLGAMANEIEMLVATNEQLEQKLIEMKAARAAAESEAVGSSERSSAMQKKNAELNAKIDESGKENLLLKQKVENLKSDMYNLLAEKEVGEAEHEKSLRSLEETITALETSKTAVRESNADRSVLRDQLRETSEKLSTANQKVENLKSDMYDLLAEKEVVEAENKKAFLCLDETASSLEASEKAVRDSNADRDDLQEQLSETSEKLAVANKELEERKESLSVLTNELEKQRRDSKVEIEQQKMKAADLEASRADLETTIQKLQKEVGEKDAALSSQEEELARLHNDLERRSMEMASAKAESKEVSSRAHDLKRRLESTESLLEESKISENFAAKLEVTNRTLMNRIDELEAAQDETMNDLNAAESSLASSVNLSKELKHQIDARGVEVDRLKAQLQILESTVTRMKSERLLQEEASQQLRGELARAAEVKVDRAVSSLKNESDSKARNLVELAAKVTARSRLIAQSKLFERTLISFIEKLMQRIEVVLDTVSTHSLMLKSVEHGKMGASAEALDLALPQSRGSSSSCDALLHVVTNAKKDFEELKQEMQVLKKGADSEECSTGLLLSPPTPKHTALSSNLSKMKSMLQGDDSSLRQVADYMELQIDGLIADLFAARRALESKEEALAELEDLVSMQQSEKETLDKNLKSMQVYIKEMETKLAEEESSRSNDECLDSAKKAAMKTAAARALGNMLLRGSNASAGQALRKWSNHACAMRAVDQQRFVADALARQLEITREKVAILKSHLKQHHSHSAAATNRRDSKPSGQLP